MKTYTQGEMDKMPYCKFDPFGHCLNSSKGEDLKHCVMCAMDEMLSSLCVKDLACTGRSHVKLLHILKKLGRVAKGCDIRMNGYNPFATDPWRRKNLSKLPQVERQICPQCNGRGKIFKNSCWELGWKPCPPCNGTGYVEYRAPPWSR